MSGSVRNFRWTKASLAAAELLIEDELDDYEIAAKVGVSDRQLRRWKQHAEFQAKMNEIAARLEAAMLRYPIAKKRKRLERYNRDWERMQQVIVERADDPTMADVPGGTTGLLVKQLKSIGFGENNTVVEEYAVDTALLKELRATEQQAAQELGQWTEKSEQKVDASEAFIQALREFGRGRIA